MAEQAPLLRSSGNIKLWVGTEIDFARHEVIIGRDVTNGATPSNLIHAQLFYYLVGGATLKKLLIPSFPGSLWENVSVRDSERKPNMISSLTCGVSKHWSIIPQGWLGKQY